MKSGRMPTKRRWRAVGSAEQLSQGHAGILGSHEGLAHQKSIDVMSLHQRHLLAPLQAAFGDDDPIARDAIEQIERSLQTGLEGAEIAVIHAYQRGVKHARA